MPWPLEAPTTRTRTAVALIDQPNKVSKNVDDYVAAMTRRYLTAASTAAPSQGEVEDDEVADEL